MPDPLPGPDDPLADVLREARVVLGRQRAIAGPRRALGPPPAAPAASAPIAPPADDGAALAPVSDPDPAPDVSNLFGESAPTDTPEGDGAANDARSPYERIAALVPDDSPLAALDSLDALRDWLQDTILVPIDEGRIQPVLGTGDPDADLMIVGEAPGADEDRTGEPFVGRAGQLLNKILEAVNFKREEVYITNILKSRPPGNRDPEPDEVAAHLPILHKQIALVRPKVILAVGKSAGNGLLGKQSSLANLRGKEHDFHGLPFFVTYHPAALLRNEQWKRPTWEDVKLLRTRYDEIRGQ